MGMKRGQGVDAITEAHPLSDAVCHLLGRSECPAGQLVEQEIACDNLKARLSCDAM